MAMGQTPTPQQRIQMDRAQVLAARGEQEVDIPDNGEQTPEVLRYENSETLMPQTECESISRQGILPREKGPHEKTNIADSDQINIALLCAAALNWVAECASRMR